MSEIKVNKISPRSGTGVTLGDSGDTFTVPSGGAITIASGATITNSGTAVNFSAGTKNVFCTLPAKRTVSPVMTATGFVVTHASTLNEDQTLDSGVLAGPVTVTGTQTITGTLVII